MLSVGIAEGVYGWRKRRITIDALRCDTTLEIIYERYDEFFPPQPDDIFGEKERIKRQ